MNFADTNWLEAIYFESPRTATVLRYMRTHIANLVVSPIVVLEARKVFTMASGDPEPKEWKKFMDDGRFYRDPMNWDLPQRDTFGLITRYGHKRTFGTFDLAIVASARLAGGTKLLSFDGDLKALAFAEGLEVWPPLDAEGKALLARLRS